MVCWCHESGASAVRTTMTSVTVILAPWLESLGVAFIALLGFMLGRWSSRLPKPYWLVAYVIPLGLITLYCLAAFEPAVAMVPPVSWMTIGRSRFVTFNFVATMLLSAPLHRLPQKRNRVVVCVLICVLTGVAIVPFLAPAFNRGYLAGLKTRIDADGVCRQSNEYTCGPAAAVEYPKEVIPLLVRAMGDSQQSVSGYAAKFLGEMGTNGIAAFGALSNVVETGNAYTMVQALSTVSV